MTAVEPPGEALPKVLVREKFPELLVQEPDFQKVSFEWLKSLSSNWLRIVSKTTKFPIRSFPNNSSAASPDHFATSGIIACLPGTILSKVPFMVCLIRSGIACFVKLSLMLSSPLIFLTAMRPRAT